ncbi:hypothetical protein BD770DRAFT_146525 [Pilaira anomala]|nr:hypothetical protein BD770DRAFT_146525 [Pilaira anomala]
MKLYRAETGSSIPWNNNNTIETLEQFNEAIEKCTGIPPDIQIILTSRGDIVKENTLKSVVKTTDKNEEELVFCYDTDHLNAEDDIIQMVIEREVPSLKAKRVFQGAAQIQKIHKEFRSKTAQENCRAYKDILNVFKDYTEYVMETIHTHQIMARTIIREQKNQTMAINVGLSSLKTYMNSITEITTSFTKRGKKELKKQTKLLATLDQDLKALEHTELYPAILNLLDSKDRNKKNLKEFLNTDEIERIRKETQVLVNDLTINISDLEQALAELKGFVQDLVDYVSENTHLQWLDDVYSHTTVIIRSAARCQKDANDCYGRGQTALQEMESNQKLDNHHRKFTTLHQLVLYILDDPLTDLEKDDDHLRQYLVQFIDSKRKSMNTYFNSMKTISKIHTHIANIQLLCDQSWDLLEHFKKKFGKRDLQIVRQTLFSYGGLLLEVLRRKRYNYVLTINTSTLMEILAKYHALEETRRGYFLKTVKNSLPFTLIGFDQVAPQGEIQLFGTEQDSNQDEMNEEEVLNIISLMTNIYNSQGPSMAKQPSFLKNPKSLLKASKMDENQKSSSFLDVMTNHLNNMDSDFLTAIWTEFFPEKEVNAKRIKQVIAQQSIIESALNDNEKLNQEEDEKLDQEEDEKLVQKDQKDNEKLVQKDNEKLVQKDNEKFIQKDNEKSKQIDDEHERQLAKLREDIKNLEIEKESLENKVEDLQHTANSIHNESQNQKKINALQAEIAKEEFDQKVYIYIYIKLHLIFFF